LGDFLLFLKLSSSKSATKGISNKTWGEL
jgi:hypothetical protein